MPIDLTKVFSAVSEVPKDAIGEFAVFTNEIEDFKNIREQPTRIGYLTDVAPLGFENRFVCNCGARYRYCLLDKNIDNMPKFVPFYEFKQDPYSWYVFDHKKIEIEEKSSGKTFTLEGLDYETIGKIIMIYIKYTIISSFVTFIFVSLIIA